MPKIIAFTHRLIPRNRRGSILIMVVAVLVLLALMGTAYISTARLDRQAADVANTATAQDVANQLITSVEDDAKQVILKDIYDSTNGYRPPELDAVTPGASVIPQYDNWDSPIVNNRQNPGSTGYANNPYQQNDAWMAVRLPDELKNTDPSYGTVGRVVTWRAISRPLTDDMTSSAETLFESPYAVPSLIVPGSSYPKWTQSVMPSSADGVVAERVGISDIVISYPTSYPDAAMAGKTRVFPAMFLTNLQGTPLYKDASGKPIKFLAADADGDGIADSGLVPLLPNGGEINGIKFYYAARIIDNNSAINVNTAWSSVGDFDTGTTTLTPNADYAFFTGNVSLLELLNQVNPASGQMDEINRHRFGFYASGMAAPYVANTTPLEDPPSGSNTPVDRSADFKYSLQPLPPANSQIAAAYFQMNTRLDNPGIHDFNNNTIHRYVPFDWTSSAQLAYRFSMMNPDGDQPVTNPANTRNDTGRQPINMIDLAFFDGGYHNSTSGVDSIFSGAANYDINHNYRFKFFPADMMGYWFRYSLDFNNQTADSGDPLITTDRSNSWTQPYVNSVPTVVPMGSLPPVPLRAILTARNPVSNSMVVHPGSGPFNVPNEAMLAYECKGRWNPNRPYNHDDIVVWGIAASRSPDGLAHSSDAYICINTSGTPASTGADLGPDSPLNTADWARIVPEGISESGVSYPAGSAVRYDSSGANVYDYYKVFIVDTSAPETPGASGPSGAGWYALQTPPYAPPKAGLNTAPFAELFRDFWNVTCGSQGSRTPFDSVTYDAIQNDTNAASDRRGNIGAKQIGLPGTFNDPYIGMKFGDQPTFTPLPASIPGVATQVHPSQMFRSPIRSLPGTTGVTPLFNTSAARLPTDQVAVLRAAIAAVNVEDMRDADSDVTGRLVHLEGYWGNNGSLQRQPVNVVVYGSEPQPFITEIYVSNDPLAGKTVTDPEANPNGYVAVEIYNPYNFPIPLTGYRLLSFDRDPVTNIPLDPTLSPTLTPVLVADFSKSTDVRAEGGTAAPANIPANGYLLLENYDADSPGSVGGTATVRPASSGLPPTGPISTTTPATFIAAFCPNLSSGSGAAVQTVLNHEMLLVKRRRFDGTPSSGTYDNSTFVGKTTWDDNEATNANGAVGAYEDMVPVDSYDFTGLSLYVDGSGAKRQQWHYARASGTTNAWKFIYPGRYDAGQSSQATPLPRQQGTQHAEWTPDSSPAQTDPWDPNQPGGAQPTPGMTLGQNFSGGASVAGSPDNPLATIPNSFTIQWANGNFSSSATPGASVGFNAWTTGVNHFPYGGFMRNGDVLSVPFIGAYKIVNPATAFNTQLIEMNSVTMDASMAEDTSTGDDVGVVAPTGKYTDNIENVGRFIPPSTTGTALTAYEWCSHIFDYFTAIQNPHDDFMPDMDPVIAPPTTGTPSESGVANAGAVNANTLEDRDAPIDGLVNVNTAPWKVLAALPLVINSSTGQIDQKLTDELAQLIVQVRDTKDPNNPAGQPHGPFKSLFELNQVAVSLGAANNFQDMAGNLSAANNGAQQGDFTPYTGGTGVGFNFDYEWKYANLIRLSNLLTTRSDSYTVYVIVQGWKNADNPNPLLPPELVAEKRSAFIVDRSRVNSDNQTLGVYPVPTR